MISTNIKIIIAVVAVLIIAVIAYFLLKKDAVVPVPVPVATTETEHQVTSSQGSGSQGSGVQHEVTPVSNAVKKEVYCVETTQGSQFATEVTTKYGAEVATYTQALEAVKSGAKFPVWAWVVKSGGVTGPNMQSLLAVCTILTEPSDTTAPAEDKKFLNSNTAAEGSWLLSHTLAYGIKPSVVVGCPNTSACKILPWNSTKWSKWE